MVQEGRITGNYNKRADRAQIGGVLDPATIILLGTTEIALTAVIQVVAETILLMMTNGVPDCAMIIPLGTTEIALTAVTQVAVETVLLMMMNGMLAVEGVPDPATMIPLGTTEIAHMAVIQVVTETVLLTMTTNGMLAVREVLGVICVITEILLKMTIGMLTIGEVPGPVVGTSEKSHVRMGFSKRNDTTYKQSPCDVEKGTLRPGDGVARGLGSERIQISRLSPWNLGNWNLQIHGMSANHGGEQLGVAAKSRGHAEMLRTSRLGSRGVGTVAARMRSSYGAQDPLHHRSSHNLDAYEQIWCDIEIKIPDFYPEIDVTIIPHGTTEIALTAVIQVVADSTQRPLS
ncbi:hypothetical protein BU15DRAFT_63869 [Melanogaster broomeanus]|nr:hypothetical protein BU15DRAFT_63869 [Melanogaster broomeanus]